MRSYKDKLLPRSGFPLPPPTQKKPGDLVIVSSAQGVVTRRVGQEG